MNSLFPRPGLALFIGVIMAFVLSLILPNIEDITLKIGIPFYVLLLGTATWRFLAKADQGIYYQYCILYIMAIPVVEFLREGYKIRKVFG